MKKNYIQPQIIASVRYSLEKPLCLSDVKNKSSWGLNDDNKFTHKEWYQEGYDISGPIDFTEDDGDLSSMSKGRGGDWGSIW